VTAEAGEIGGPTEGSGGVAGGSNVIDLNADLGESFGAWRLGDDQALLTVVTSANVACGFHAGDPLTLRKACAGAVANGVSIGAQVSYRDLAGFGRREMVVPPDELTAEVLYQIAALDGIARAEGGRVSYVKPHGALYKRAVRDPVQAAAIVAAISAYDPRLPLLTLPGSESGRAAAAAGLSVVAEGFADRAYRADGTLVPRGQPGAVISDPDLVAPRAAQIATDHVLLAADGQQVTVPVRSLCLHGDTPGAVTLARAVRGALERAGVTVAPFA
jgi:5-oxoprolinase (ATP-hydrolysing) subunit A